jgi:membrane-associated phospholipid phosphatase
MCKDSKHCKCHKDKNCDDKHNKCLDRDYLCKNADIKSKLASLNDSRPYCNQPRNHDECKYKKYRYSASFTKSLPHDADTGLLSDPCDYEKLVEYITKNKQKKLSKLLLATDSEIKLSDPLASLSSVLIGSDQCANKLCSPPRLSSEAAAAEMVELYSMALARDSPFSLYSTDSTITNVLTFMNTTNVKKYLPDYLPAGIIDSSNIFRGKSIGDLIGPHISQLLFLNVPIGASTLEQKYLVYPDFTTAVGSSIGIEWGRNSAETIDVQNGALSGLPAIPTSAQLLSRYIFSGRALSEAVHNDPAFACYYNAALILSGLGAGFNTGFPTYDNQNAFVTNGALPALLSALGEVTELALKHAWYWKWQVFRKLRPEVFSLWIDDIKNGRVVNTDNFDIDDTVLTNAVLDDIVAHNLEWGSEFADAYTLPTTYREGAPVHPSYPGGHATVAGACATLLKIFFDCEHKWSTLSGLQAGSIDRRIVPSTVTTGPLAITNAAGTSLVDYTGSDAANVTIWGEINKLASNISIGRNWAGVHYRTDATHGIALGEQIAISYMKDLMSTWVQNDIEDCDKDAPSLKFRKFDGSICTIKPLVCANKGKKC